jgi:hypothetical protein
MLFLEVLGIASFYTLPGFFLSWFPGELCLAVVQNLINLAQANLRAGMRMMAAMFWTILSTPPPDKRSL